MKTKRYDDGGVTGSAGVPDTGIEAAPNYLSPNYQPARSVGRGVAVAQPSPSGRSPFRTMDSFVEPRGLLPGQITPMTGTEMQRVLASGDPDSIGSKLATGYQQLFGRDIDPSGADYYLRNLQTVNDPNQPLGARSSQADINRFLLGGAQGGDREAAMDYQMSLTGGRPEPGARQFFQPVYQPEAYANYRQIPFTQTRAPSMFNQTGFNPFGFTDPSSSRNLRQMLPSGFADLSPNEKINYFNRVGATPQEIMRGDPTLTPEGLNYMAVQGYQGGGSGGRNLRASLPGGFSDLSPSEKINYFNQIGATRQDLLASDPTLTLEGLNYMTSQGYQGGTNQANPFSYTGYQPFSGMTNPYSRRVGSGVAVQGQIPQASMQQYALKQGGKVTDGIRAVRYLKR